MDPAEREGGRTFPPGGGGGLVLLPREPTLPGARSMFRVHTGPLGRRTEEGLMISSVSDM